jgi:hypothetical protein
LTAIATTIAIAIATPTATATATTTTAATALATTTATKVKGNIWVNGQRLAAAGEDGWWCQISSSLSECWFFQQQILVVSWKNCARPKLNKSLCPFFVGKAVTPGP